MKRIIYRLIRPKLVKILDYVASYPSQWIDGGVPIKVLRKKFDEEYLEQLVDKNYLIIEDESIGIDDLKRKVYSLTPKSHAIAHSQKKNKNNINKWFWWFMSIIGAVIAGLVLAYVFGVGR